MEPNLSVVIVRFAAGASAPPAIAPSTARMMIRAVRPSFTSNALPSGVKLDPLALHPRQTRVCLGWRLPGPLAPIYCQI